jgi:cytochrome c oxidase assembly factor CtaG
VSDHNLIPLAACAIPGTLFLLGIGRLWRSSNRSRPALAISLGLGSAGFMVIVLTLLSPLHHWSQMSFTFHMIEHELLMAVAAPLIAAGRPELMLWAFPSAWRPPIGRGMRRLRTGVLWRCISRPLGATLLNGLSTWVWHVPVLFNAALESTVLHWLQHASFFFTALLFWHVALKERGATAGVSMACLFATSVHTSLLGALMTFSRRVWYGAPAQSPDWALSPLADQQLAGLIMWIPGGMLYAAAALWLAFHWIGGDRRYGKEVDNAPAD